LKVIFSHAINCVLAPPCGHLWPLVHNTVNIKPIIAHLLVHVNYWNITSGTGSYTLPVNFAQLVHPITLQKINFCRKFFAVESVYFISDTDILTPVRTRGLKGHFSHLETIFFGKKSQNQKKSYVLKWPEKNSLQDSLNTLKPIFDFKNSLFQIVSHNNARQSKAVATLWLTFV
jgi:hypothetical protein